MKRIGLLAVTLLAVAVWRSGVPLAGQTFAPTPTSVTFTKHVLPILQENCQSCHRPGEVAPFSLLSYQDARPWARAIKKAVSSRQMPPWFAEDGYAKFSNERKLSEADLQTIVAWVDQGAPEGDPEDAPPPLQFEDGWQIKPDMVIEMPQAFHLPRSGTINMQNQLVKVDFPEDRWVIAAEFRPGNRKGVHHSRANLRPPDSNAMKGAEYGRFYESNEQGVVDLLGKFNPGLADQIFNKYDSAKFVPKGSDVIFGQHYTTYGEEGDDVSKLGLVFAPKGWTPKYRYFVRNGPMARNLAIPAHDPNAEVVGELTTQVPMSLVYLQPHMHLRGKDFEFRIIFPSGEQRTVLKGKWDFNWQLGYDLAEPIELPVGTRLISIAHFDNSTENKYNPDPTKLILWGVQTWDEMMNIFIGVLVDPKLDQRTFFKESGPSLLKRGTSGPTLQTLLQPPSAGATR
jgi:hypothetical protein